MQQLTFLDLCSGIGGFRLGLESAGIGVSVIVNMTDLRGLLMKQCTTRKESGKQMMSQNLNQKMSPMQTSGVSDSHARTSPLQENSGDLSESEVGYITTLLTSSKAKKKVISPHTFLLRTLRTCYQLIQLRLCQRSV